MPENRAPTADRLRHAIDSGRTGDKVAFPDPAAAPLGTDDEAAGHAPTVDERAIAARAERRVGSPDRKLDLSAPALAALVAAMLLGLALAWALWAR